MKRMAESKMNLSYTIMTKRSMDNDVNHDEALSLIMADPDFVPHLKTIKAAQVESQ
jgi:hypothetical protein